MDWRVRAMTRFRNKYLLTPFAELDTFANESDVMWRGFVASAVAAVSLQWVNPFGTAKLVLFQVCFLDLITVLS